MTFIRFRTPLSLLFLMIALTFINGCAHESRRIELIDLQAQARQAYLDKNWASAGRYFMQLTDAMPKDAENWYWLGNTYARLDQPADAILAYREALLRNTKHSRAWHNLAVMHLRQSAASLLEMQKYIGPDDPLFVRSEQMVQTVFQLLGTQKLRNNHSVDNAGIDWGSIVVKTKNLNEDGFNQTQDPDEEP